MFGYKPFSSVGTPLRNSIQKSQFELAYISYSRYQLHNLEVDIRGLPPPPQSVLYLEHTVKDGPLATNTIVL